MRRRDVSRVLLATLLAGCASFGRPAPEDEQVVVTLRSPVATAVRRTAAAFREQGYDVRPTLTSGTRPETEPFRTRGGGGEAVFRAVVADAGGGTSRVVLTGTWHQRQLGGIVEGRKTKVTRNDAGDEGELWARLVNLGVAIRTGG